MHSTQIKMCVEFEDCNTNIKFLIGINVTKEKKYCYRIKNTYDIVQIIDVHFSSRQMHMYNLMKISHSVG